MAHITLKVVLDRIRGTMPKTYALEAVALLAALKKAGTAQTPKEMTLAVLADKGKTYPALYARTQAIDTVSVIERARIGKVTSSLRSAKTALIKAQPNELFPVFETVNVNVGVKVEHRIVLAHEAMKVQEQRVQICRRSQLMEKNGAAGVVKIKKFVMLVSGHQFNPPPVK